MYQHPGDTMNDSLESVISATLAKQMISPPRTAAGPSVDLISFQRDAGLAYEKVRLFQRLVRERYGIDLTVVGGGYGCIRITFVGGSERGADYTLRIFQNKEFQKLAASIGFDIQIVDNPYVRTPIGGMSPRLVGDQPDVDFIMLSPLFDPEYDSLYTQLQTMAGRPGAVLESDNLVVTEHLINVKFQTDLQNMRVIAAYLPRMGNVPAAATTAQLLQRWQPRWLFLVGIAGGLASDGMKVGDVVVGEQVCHYDARRKVTGVAKDWQAAPVTYSANDNLLDMVRRMAFDDQFMRSWQQDLAVETAVGTDFPCVRFGDIAAGDAVVDSGVYLKRIKKQNRKLLAVEMEAAGVFEAARQTGYEANTLVFRGISDFADGQKHDRHRGYAAKAAAALAVHVARRITADQGQHAASPRRSATSEPSPTSESIRD